MEAETKYALIVKKFYLGKGPNFEDLYMFRPVEMLDGMMDEDGMTFLNNNGREYYPIDVILSGSIENADEAYVECFNIEELYSIYNISTQGEIYNHYKDKLMDLVYIGVDHMPDKPGTQFDLKELNKKELLEYGEKRFALAGDKCIVPLSMINELLESDDLEGIKAFFSSVETIKGNIEQYIAENLEKIIAKSAEDSVKEDDSPEESKEEKQTDDVKIYDREKEATYEEIFGEDNYEDYLSPRERIKKLRKVLKETIVGQEKAIDMMCYALYKNMKLKDGEKRTSPLLIGPTGSGKTLMLETIEKELDIPTIVIDANTLSTTGYVGKNLTDYIGTLIEKAGGDVTKAEHGIVCIDEIDKKGSDNNEDVGGKGVINQGLKFIEGCVYDIECIVNGRKKIVHFNTKNLTVCTSGAFPEIFEKKLREKGKNTIGFNGHISTKEELEDYEDIEITKKDIAETGKMGPEYAGRVLAVVFNKLSVEDLIEQMQRSKSSELTNEIKVLESDNIIFNYGDEFVRKIAEDAYKQGTGGRAVRDIIEQSFSGIVTKILFEDDSYNEDDKYYIYGTVTEEGELSIISETGEELIERKSEKKKDGKKVLVKTDKKV